MTGDPNLNNVFIFKQSSCKVYGYILVLKYEMMATCSHSCSKKLDNECEDFS